MTTFDESLQGIRREDGVYFQDGSVVSHPEYGVGQIIRLIKESSEVVIVFVKYPLTRRVVPVSELTLK